MGEVQQFFEFYAMGASASILFAVLFFGTFISEDAACILAGTLVASGAMSFQLALSACFLGIFVGDVGLYWLGRGFGPRLFETTLFGRFVSKSTIARASGWLQKRGAAAIFLSRFVAGFRLPTYVLAGALKVSFPRFAFFFLVAAAIWTPILVGSVAFAQSMFFSSNALIGLVALFFAIRLVHKYSSWRNRRLLVGRIRRLTNWEFWPLWVFYAPVVVYILWLGLRFRRPTAFASANPAILAGGFKGESKNDIYRLLATNEEAPGHLLRYFVVLNQLSASERLSAAEGSMSAAGLGFPVVVKPDAGERGAGVEIVRNRSELQAAFESAKQPVIVQEFAAGVEASVFYYRFPGEDRGRIFSITEKRFPEVIGDGNSTLEELILKDPRAVAMAEKYFERNAKQLSRVLATGERFRLIDIGTHSRGAIFLDGGHLLTPELERRIDAICRGLVGFNFGRFDLRADSFDAFKAGQFCIIELNGVTSESTNIYDPRYTLLDAYRILFRQWRIAFEVGLANIANGAEPVSVGELIRLTFGGQPAVKPRENAEQCA